VESKERLYDDGAILRPCPFCGGKPEVYPVDWEKGGDDWGMVKCNNEYCHAMPQVEVHGEGNGESGQKASWANKTAARKLWNNRA
jgi:hypothetical protein